MTGIDCLEALDFQRPDALFQCKPAAAPAATTLRQTSLDLHAPSLIVVLAGVSAVAPHRHDSTLDVVIHIAAECTIACSPLLAPCRLLILELLGLTVVLVALEPLLPLCSPVLLLLRTCLDGLHTWIASRGGSPPALRARQGSIALPCGVADLVFTDTIRTQTARLALALGQQALLLQEGAPLALLEGLHLLAHIGRGIGSEVGRTRP